MKKIEQNKMHTQIKKVYQHPKDKVAKLYVQD